jgi:hypothetical protein
VGGDDVWTEKCGHHVPESYESDIPRLVGGESWKCISMT